MAMAFVTGTAPNIAASAISTHIIDPLIQQIDDVIHVDENRRLLRDQLNHMKGLLRDISYQFYDRQKATPESLRNCLERMEGEVRKARELIDRSQSPQQSCMGIHCVCLFELSLSRQIRKWTTSFNGLFDELRNDFQLFSSAQLIAFFSPQQAEMKIERLLTESPHVRRVCVYGSSGVGKTTLLRKIYNAHKVSDAFDAVIWVTVAQFPILELQGAIASELNLELPETDVVERMMKLSAYLKAKNFFLVLDDMWTEIDLEKLGVEFNNHRVSKVIFSTRNRDLIEEMKAEESMKIEPMSTDEEWDLFSKVAFKDAGESDVPEEIVRIAREVSSECKGLPLAINVIASSMIGKSDVNEWKHALRQMQKSRDFIDPIVHHPHIDRDLFQRLRWSYDCLPDSNLKNCFLYCAMFPQATQFPVKPLVQMWIAESLVNTKDDGHEFVQFLQDRYLFQLQSTENVITVHDAVRDMAIYIGETSKEKCVFRARQMLQQFPLSRGINDCKRISVVGSNIKSLPAWELGCQQLVTLFLGKLELKEIPEAFLGGLTSLRVLDLGGTQVKSLPLSLWELRELKFLNLSWTQIENLDERIGNLSSLQFLNLSHCMKLKSLPSQIVKLKNLRYFDFSECDNLRLIPKEITILPNCEVIVQ